MKLKYLAGLAQNFYEEIINKFVEVTERKYVGSPKGSGIGWIIDGLPRSKAEADLLTSLKLLPDFIITLNDGKDWHYFKPDVDSESDGDQLALRANDEFSLFDSAYESYSESVEHIIKSLMESPLIEELGRKPQFIELNCNLSPTEIFGQILPSVGPLIQKAVSVEVTENSIPTNIVNPDDIEYFSMGDWVFGATRNYCPVSLVDSNALIPGKEEHAAQYLVS